RTGAQLFALAEGFGVAWVNDLSKPDNLSLRLPEDLPIRGKVVDLEGKAVAGAAVRIVELSTTESGNLEEFLKRWAMDKEKSPTGPAFHLLTEKMLWASQALATLPAATSGPDGKFQLTGIGRDRGLMLGIRGKAFADHYVRVITRPDFPAQ